MGHASCPDCIQDILYRAFPLDKAEIFGPLCAFAACSELCTVEVDDGGREENPMQVDQIPFLVFLLLNNINPREGCKSSVLAADFWTASGLGPEIELFSVLFF